MGYYTSFTGEFEFDKPLTPEHLAYINRFAESRRMKRDAERAEKLEDPLRVAVGLPLGADAEFYVGSAEIDKKLNAICGQGADKAIVDYNRPSATQPSLWCPWDTCEDGSALLIEDEGKHYEYELWLTYLIENFFTPWGYKLSGTVYWYGEDSDDLGLIEIAEEDNSFVVRTGKIVYK